MRGFFRASIHFLISLLGCWLIGFLIFTQFVKHPPSLPDLKTETIIVLTGGQNRLDVGLNLLLSGKADTLFVTGVHTEISKQKLVDLFLPQATLLKTKERDTLLNRIVLDYSAKNTYENAHEAALWIQEKGIKSIRLITSNYHMLRSLLEFNAILKDTLIIPHPVSPQHLRPLDWWLWPKTTGLLMREYTKCLGALIFYVFRKDPVS